VARASPRCKTRGLKGAAAHGGRYMRLGYAHMDNLPFAAIKNRAGSYVTPDPNPAASLAVALPSSIASPRWDRVNLAVNGAGGGGGARREAAQHDVALWCVLRRPSQAGPAD